MASFSKLVTELTGFGFGYFRDSHSASHAFGQDATTLDAAQPRFTFEYFVKINLNEQSGAAKDWSDHMKGTNTGFGAVTSKIASVVDSAVKSILPEKVSGLLGVGGAGGPKFEDMFPLIKSVDMPNMTIDTAMLNEYNRRRTSQTKINFEPVKMVIHDTVDGKALKFWQTFYEYYYKDGRVWENPEETDPGANSAETVIRTGQQRPGGVTWTDTFGYNLPRVDVNRDMISSIDIFLVHNAKFNQVTLMHPRISAFKQDTFNYDKNGIMECTFTFDYEYVVYDRGRKALEKADKELFEFSDFLELPSLAISSAIGDLLGAVNPLSGSSSPIVANIGRNVQSAATQVVGKAVSKTIRKASASVLDGMANISPTPEHPSPPVPAAVRSFTPGVTGG